MVHLCDLMVKIFERHGKDGDNNLQDLRPVGNRSCFRDGLNEYPDANGGVHVMLYYDQKLPNGTFTCRAVSKVIKN